MHITEAESRLRSKQLLSNFQADISCEVKIKAEVKNGVALKKCRTDQKVYV